MARPAATDARGHDGVEMGQEIAAVETLPHKIGRIWLREMKHILPPTIYFFCAFNLIVLTTNWVSTSYWFVLSGFALATTSALIVGKAVLVADKLPVIDRFRNAPLIKPILFKTVFYTAVVFVARMLELLGHMALNEGGFNAGFEEELVKFSWQRFAAVQVWILTCFLIYVTARELSHLAGPGELRRLFFKARPSEWQLSRREHIRTLLEIARVAQTAPAEEILNPASADGQKIAGLVDALRRKRA